MKAVLHVNHVSGGFMESYYLKTNNYPDALTAAETLCNYRRSFLATGTEIVWARVSFLGNPRERQGLGGLPLGPLPQSPQDDPVNSMQDALHYAFETATGRWGNRLFRACPDTLIRDAKFTGIMPEPLNPALALSNPLDGGASLTRIRQSFLRWLIINTQNIRVVAKGPPPDGEAQAWSRCLARKVTTRDTGRPFGLHRGRAAS